MRDIKILCDSAKTGRRSKQRPIRRFIQGAAKKLFIDKTFDGQNRMAVVGLPVLREPIQAKLHRPRAQVGKLGAIGEDEKTAVLADKR